MDTEDLEVLLKITDIDIKIAELKEKQRKANRKRRRMIRLSLIHISEPTRPY